LDLNKALVVLFSVFPGFCLRQVVMNASWLSIKAGLSSVKKKNKVTDAA
jgi:hypothetical protein